MLFVKILLGCLIAVFAGYQIYALIRDLKAKKKKPPDHKEDEK